MFARANCNYSNRKTRHQKHHNRKRRFEFVIHLQRQPNNVGRFLNTHIHLNCCHEKIYAHMHFRYPADKLQTNS